MTSRDETIKAHIIQSSKAVFRNYGYSKVTMDDIAKASGKGRSTLYYYYKNKHDVFEEVAQEEYLAIIEPAARKVTENNSLFDNLVGYNQTKLKALTKKTKEYKHLLNDIKEHQDFTEKVFRRVRQKEVDLVKQMLSWAIEKKEIAPISDTDLDFLTIAIVTTVSSLEKEMLLYGSISDMSTRVHWLVNLLIKGLQ